jgi:dipeptidyl aminopeptidase/acylaminoacyl peptidase
VRELSPYGTWSSPLSAEVVATGEVWLEEVQLRGGVCYWLEERPAEEGRHVIVTGDALSSGRDLTPEGFSARTKVHEYGGGSYWTHNGTVFFANFDDQRLYRADDGAPPVPITPETEGRYRYADGETTADGSLIVCVRERHEDDDVINEIVAMRADGSGEARVVVGGRDFFSNPRISPDGSRLTWLAWDLPWMPWDGCELWVAELAKDGSVRGARLVAGRLDDESIFQPMWSPAGELHFVSDRTGWWNLYRERGGEVAPLYPMEAEFGWPQWVFGETSYGFLGDGRIPCIYGQEGVQHVALLDPEAGELLDLDLPYTAISFPSLAAEGSHILFIGSSPTIPPQVVLLDFTSRSVEVLRSSADRPVDPGYLSVPRQISFPTEGGLTAHAHFYPPVNRDFGPVGDPDQERPPLIVMSHGGPTSQSSAAFDLNKQFFTSRGFAVVDVNYGGSTGYGREYRRRLNGKWGVVDTTDCVNAARYLASLGEVDGDRLLIRGGSAGGYTTLCALTFHDDFAAGASYYGISDLEPFATGQTHKFERQYEHTLVGPFPEAIDIYRERSPIHYVDRISCPMILFQGDQDEVVPPAQAQVMVDALKAKGLPFAYLLFADEQHGFRKSGNIARSLEAEVSFYAQILGFDLGDRIEPVQIQNLSRSQRPGTLPS